MKTKFSEFLNPRSMLTPGIAGSIIMLITNTLWLEFAIPQRWSALSLSFFLTLLIISKYSLALLERVIYFVFNSLIIFSLAINSNFVGKKVAKDEAKVVPKAAKVYYYAPQGDGTSTRYYRYKAPTQPVSKSGADKPRQFFESWL